MLMKTIRREPSRTFRTELPARWNSSFATPFLPQSCKSCLSLFAPKISKLLSPSSLDGFGVFFPTRVSSFGDHIFNVICLATKKKMSGVNAGSIITAMANAHFIWDNAYMNHKRDTMNINNLSKVAHFSIPALILGPRVDPTITSNLNAFKQSSFCIGIFHGIHNITDPRGMLWQI